MFSSKLFNKFGSTGSVLLAVAVGVFFYGLRLSNIGLMLLAAGIAGCVFAWGRFSDCHTSFSVTYHDDSSGSFSLFNLLAGAMWSVLALAAFLLALQRYLPRFLNI